MRGGVEKRESSPRPQPALFLDSQPQVGVPARRPLILMNVSVSLFVLLLFGFDWVITLHPAALASVPYGIVLVRVRVLAFIRF